MMKDRVMLELRYHSLFVWTAVCRTARPVVWEEGAWRLPPTRLCLY